MKQEKSNILQDWFKSNIWNLFLTGIGIILAFTALQAQVQANKLEIQRVNEKVATYPSEEYFDLRFSTLENAQQDLKAQIQEVKNDVKTLQSN